MEEECSSVNDLTTSSYQNSLTGCLISSSSQNSLTGSKVAGFCQNPTSGGTTAIMKEPRKRKRKLCPKCGQFLSHSAYSRHLNSTVCPSVEEGETLKDCLSTHSASNYGADEFSELAEEKTVTESDDSGEENVIECPETEESDSDHECSLSGSSDHSDDEVVVSDNESIENLENLNNETSNDNDNTHVPRETLGQNERIKRILIHVTLFLTFFQLCYRISERGITLLLMFLKSLFYWLSSTCTSDNLKLLADNMPLNVYYLKKLTGAENDIMLYVSCPKCHSVYKHEDCIIKVNGQSKSLQCTYVEFPNHPQSRRRSPCGALLLRSVKRGSVTKLLPFKVYPYISLKKSLTKLCKRSDFLNMCEQWRNRKELPNVFSDVYDGNVWKNFQVVDNIPFLQAPNNISLKLNLDWFNPFEHIQYSVGVLYLVVENLPRSERYKMQNIILVGTIPGPKEPKNNINSYLKPLVDELLTFWDGTLLKTSNLFGVTPIRCALTCVTCDLPATRKICGFKSFSSLHGCSKCLKEFPCDSFGTKSDYSGYDRDQWQKRTHNEHLEQVAKVIAANTASKRDEIEKKYGVRYSELLRLPYFDIVSFHVIDPMHNLLLGTAKHITSLWKDQEILSSEDLRKIQEKVDKIKTPPKIGRIPHKIISNFSSLTADQWKNWIFVYSLYTLHGILPDTHYTCWNIFVDACRSLLRPSLSMCELNRADEKFLEFCVCFERLYGKKFATPNMHLHLHIKECVLDYGPVYAFWCFPFERFNGILGSFQMNWMLPELQMLKKFTTYQHLLLYEVDSAVPEELSEFFRFQFRKQKLQLVGEGSLEETHIDYICMHEYKHNRECPLPMLIASCIPELKIISKKSRKWFNHEEVSWLSTVYQKLYPSLEIGHVPMMHERFHGVSVFGKTILSAGARGNHSAVICAYWILQEEGINSDNLCYGKILYFFRHCMSFESQAINYMFARIQWFKTHPRQNWFSPHLAVVDTDVYDSGPPVFMPISRIFDSCAVITDQIKFDYGEDKVKVVIKISNEL